jgi:hypothetical protein
MPLFAAIPILKKRSTWRKCGDKIKEQPTEWKTGLPFGPPPGNKKIGGSPCATPPRLRVRRGWIVCDSRWSVAGSRRAGIGVEAAPGGRESDSKADDPTLEGASGVSNLPAVNSGDARVDVRHCPGAPRPTPAAPLLPAAPIADRRQRPRLRGRAAFIFPSELTEYGDCYIGSVPMGDKPKEPVRNRRCGLGAVVIVRHGP